MRCPCQPRGASHRRLGVRLLPMLAGKTMLAKAVAHHTTASFIRVVGSEFVQKYLGEVRGGMQVEILLGFMGCGCLAGFHGRTAHATLPMPRCPCCAAHAALPMPRCSCRAAHAALPMLRCPCRAAHAAHCLAMLPCACVMLGMLQMFACPRACRGRAWCATCSGWPSRTRPASFLWTRCAPARPDHSSTTAGVGHVPVGWACSMVLRRLASCGGLHGQA